MANYPKELTDLVEEYLTDGIISTKERQVLLKKAQQLGVDVDEFDLYIDAQQQKADQQVDAASRKQRGKTCPFCGGVVPQLTDRCPHCGETITAEASEELQEIFDHLEEALVDFKSGKDIEKSKAVVERYVRKAKMYYENNPKVQKLLAEVQRETENAEKDNEKRRKEEKVASRNSYIKKNIGTIIFILVMVTVLPLCGYFLTLSEKDPSHNAQACIEAVNEALKEGDIAKAESIYMGFCQKHRKSLTRDDETYLVDPAKEAIDEAKYRESIAPSEGVNKAVDEAKQKANEALEEAMQKANEALKKAK